MLTLVAAACVGLVFGALLAHAIRTAPYECECCRRAFAVARVGGRELCGECLCGRSAATATDADPSASHPVANGSDRIEGVQRR